MGVIRKLSKTLKNVTGNVIENLKDTKEKKEQQKQIEKQERKPIIAASAMTTSTLSIDKYDSDNASDDAHLRGESCHLKPRKFVKETEEATAAASAARMSRRSNSANF
ncbi:hypothetical protein BGZ90_008215 [Linnemannia elongata]|nr:hypothetical protein BGZ90_008215 [Linnemannia elongata]